ncbi:MAG: PAS domain-containing protein, partial [Planctomycetota bacterium]
MFDQQESIQCNYSQKQMINIKPKSNNSDNSRPKYGSVEEVRNQIVNTILKTSLIISFPVVVSSLWRSLDVGWQNLMYLHILLYSLFLTITIFRKRIPFVFRVYAIISFAFILGVGGLVTWGLIGMGLFLLMTGCVFTALFLGFRAGMAFLGAAIVAVIITGLAITSGRISQNFDVELYANSRTSWILAATAFALLATMVIAGFGRLYSFLTVSMRLLEERTGELERSNVAFEVEIAERKKTEEELRGRDRLLTAIAETSRDSIFCKDSDFKYTFVNSAMERLLAIPASEIIGKTPVEIFGEEAASVIAEVDKLAFEGIIADEVRTLKINKVLHHFHTVQVPLRDDKGKINGICGIVRDLTHSKKAEEALKGKEEQLRTIGDNLPIGMIFQLKLTPDGSLKFTYVSAAVEKLHECTAEETIANPDLLFNRVHEDDINDWQQATEKATAELNVYDHEMRIRRKSGEIRYHRMISKPRRLEDGSILFDGIDIDITEPKQAQEDLRNSEERFRLLSEYSPMGAFQTDNSGRVIFTNKRWQEIAGLTLQESLGFGWSKALHPDDKDVILKEWDKCLREGKEWSGE